MACCLMFDGIVILLANFVLHHYTYQVYILFSSSAPYPPPLDVHLSDVYTDNITLTWTSVSQSCPSVYYNITSDQCGHCPGVTNSTGITCSNLTVPSTCTLQIQSMACGFIGNSSNPTMVTLKCKHSISHYICNINWVHSTFLQSLMSPDLTWSYHITIMQVRFWSSLLWGSTKRWVKHIVCFIYTHCLDNTIIEKKIIVNCDMENPNDVRFFAK